MAVRLPTVIEKLFPVASRLVDAVMERGARTHQGEDWRALPAAFHLGRARRHLDLLAVGDVSEPHLAHAACRLLMELEGIDREIETNGSSVAATPNGKKKKGVDGVLNRDPDAKIEKYFRKRAIVHRSAL